MKKFMWVLALFGLMGMLFASGGEGRAARMAAGDTTTVSSPSEGPDDSGAGEAATDNESDGGSGSAVRQSILDMRYGQMECRADFVYSTMDSAEAKGNASLSGERSALEAVMSQLNSYVEAGDVYSFNHYMSETRNAFADAVSATKRAAMDALQALSGTERQALRDELRADYDGAKTTYVECKHAAVVARIQAEMAEFENWSARGEEIADDMEERNYTVSELRETINEAQEEADELEAAADSGADTDALLEVRKEKWGTIFYLWAQFHKERVNLLLDRFEEKTEGYETQVAEIRSLLDEAASVGDDEVYTLEEAQESKALINQAMEEFSALVEGARGEA
ncbi:MAG: hypothetical protein NTY83_00225 [Candidatus Micrarchaeota archaeon]|nr:hypothetical protein [Candidatus Micrarchaeota archaeon]